MRAVLIYILLLAVVLRFWNLWSVPPSASLDEASIGYNAYSILKTGGDEYGEFPILSHRSYDDWRRAIYLHLVTPFVALFGLNVISVRFPAGILSILTILATYFLVKELFTTLNKEKRENIALLAAGLLAISPWHIYISRLGHESNAYLSFFIFGVLFFLRGEKRRNWVLILLSMFFFILSLISYYAGQIFIPLFVISLCFLFRKSLLSIVASNKKILIIFLFFIIFLVPILRSIFSPEALIRFQGTSTFKSEAHLEMYNQRLELWHKAIQNNDLFGSLIYSRHFFPFQVFTEGYISHFKPQWLFINSGSEPHKVPNMGLLYTWEIPFIAIGIIFLFASSGFNRKIKLLILIWFFLAPLPASIATGAPHAMRSYTFLPVWQIFTSIGLFYVFSKLQNFRVLGSLSFAFFISLLTNLFILLSLYTLYRNYFVVFPREQSSSFQYALSKTVPYVLSQEESYEKIIFSNKDNLYQSYMLFLFHAKYDPLIYQKQGGTISGGFAEKHRFDKYEFRPISWEKETKNEGKILYIGNPNDFPTSIMPIKTFSNLDGKEAIRIVEG